MNRSKKIFLIIAGLFMLIVLVIVIDFSRKTTFPGSKRKVQDTTQSKSSAQPATQRP